MVCQPVVIPIVYKSKTHSSLNYKPMLVTRPLVVTPSAYRRKTHSGPIDSEHKHTPRHCNKLLHAGQPETHNNNPMQFNYLGTLHIQRELVPLSKPMIRKTAGANPVTNCPTTKGCTMSHTDTGHANLQAEP